MASSIILSLEIISEDFIFRVYVLWRIYAKIKSSRIKSVLGHTNLISSSLGIFAQKVGTTNEIYF